MASKHCDKLTILLDVAEGCLSRLHYCKRQLTGAHRPSVLSDDKYAKLVKALVASYPQDPEEKEKVRNPSLLLRMLSFLDSRIRSVAQHCAEHHGVHCVFLRYFLASNGIQRHCFHGIGGSGNECGQNEGTISPDLYWQPAHAHCSWTKTQNWSFCLWT